MIQNSHCDCSDQSCAVLSEFRNSHYLLQMFRVVFWCMALLHQDFVELPNFGEEQFLGWVPPWKSPISQKKKKKSCSPPLPTQVTSCISILKITCEYNHSVIPNHVMTWTIWSYYAQL